MFDLIPNPSPIRRREQKLYNAFSEHIWIGSCTYNFQRKLRKNQTRSETVFWKVVKGRKFAGFKFRRQHPIGRYIVDFFCKELPLIVEIDWPIHKETEQRIYDKFREDDLAHLWYNLIRFTNKNIVSSIESIKFAILYIEQHLINAHNFSPSPYRRRR